DHGALRSPACPGQHDRPGNSRTRHRRVRASRDPYQGRRDRRRRVQEAQLSLNGADIPGGRRHQYNLKVTSTLMATATGSPFFNAGLNRQSATALRACVSRPSPKPLTTSRTSGTPCSLMTASSVALPVSRFSRAVDVYSGSGVCIGFGACTLPGFTRYTSLLPSSSTTAASGLFFRKLCKSV